MKQLHISISAEPVFHIGNFVITNAMLTGVLATLLILSLAFVANQAITKPTNANRKLRALTEMAVESINNLIVGITGQAKLYKFGPIIFAFFMFVMINNWVGLIPGVGTIGFMEEPKIEKTVESTTSEEHAIVPQDEHAEAAAPASHAKFVPLFRGATADINTTVALALISVIMTQIFGVQFNKLGYFTKFFNFKGPIDFFVGILELISEFAKILSFAFRLFGNIFAGEVLLSVIMFLVPVVIPMPFYGLEIFVGFIQALVFSLLSLVFFNMATMGHHDESENH